MKTMNLKWNWAFWIIFDLFKSYLNNVITTETYSKERIRKFVNLLPTCFFFPNELFDRTEWNNFRELCFQVDYGRASGRGMRSSSMTRIYQTRFLCHRRRFLTPSHRQDHGQCFGFPAMRFHVETYPGRSTARHLIAQLMANPINWESNSN